MEYREISNELIMMIKSLRKKSGREEHGLFLAEGLKVCSEIFHSLYQPMYVIIPGNANRDALDLAEKLSGTYKISIYKAQRKIFDKICDTDSPQDILAILKIPNLIPLTNETFISLDNVSDPGNVGTIIRTAEWFGFKQVILNEGCADIYNPKTVRSSMGAILKINYIKTKDLRKFIKEVFPLHFVLGTYLEGEKFNSELVKSLPKDRRIGIIFGNESSGISDDLLQVIDLKVSIPGSGRFDSLNVSVAGGIVLYELSLKK